MTRKAGESSSTARMLVAVAKTQMGSPQANREFGVMEEVPVRDQVVAEYRKSEDVPAKSEDP